MRKRIKKRKAEREKKTIVSRGFQLPVLSSIHTYNEMKKKMGKCLNKRKMPRSQGEYVKIEGNKR